MVLAEACGNRKSRSLCAGRYSSAFSTVLMLAVPARLAGCHEIVMCTPPGKEGKIAPAILYAARETGIDRILNWEECRP